MKRVQKSPGLVKAGLAMAEDMAMNDAAAETGTGAIHAAAEEENAGNLSLI
jgi:hypothetical protein